HFTSSLAQHLHLLSFPTRRSSDLVQLAVAVPVASEHHRAGALGGMLIVTGVGRESQRVRSVERRTVDDQHPTERAGTVVFTSYRSEEHTSELQSRGHLVCRLLLEK